MSVFDAAVAVLGSDEAQASVEAWLGRNPLQARVVVPDASDWWRRYCFAALTSLQRISPGFWEAFYEDPVWMAFVNAGEQDLPPDESVLQNVLRQHGVRKHLSKGKWLSRAWNDFDAHAVAAVATRLSEQHELSRTDELTVVNSLLRQGRGMGVGPKVARLMMIWDPQTGSMGSAYRRVIPLDRRWINALRQQGEDITCNLGREASYRHVEAQICRAAEHVGMLPFLADGAVFGWAP